MTKKKKVKILTDRYIPQLKMEGPILSPIEIDESTIESLINNGYRVEEVKKPLTISREENKVLFTGTSLEEKIFNEVTSNKETVLPYRNGKTETVMINHKNDNEKIQPLSQHKNDNKKKKKN